MTDEYEIDENGNYIIPIIRRSKYADAIDELFELLSKEGE